MECPACRKAFEKQDVKERKTKVLSPYIKCPSCGAWLKPDSKSQSLQLVGLALCLVGQASLGGFISLPSFLSIGLAAVGFGMFLFSFKAMKMVELNG